MWLGKNPIYKNNIQVAEVIKNQEQYHIRNLRPNGTVGICYSHWDLGKIREWLDFEYPSWTKIKKLKNE